jgi:hypothetical protein
MNSHGIEILMVLAPAITGVTLGFAIEAAKGIYAKLRKMMHNASSVEYVMELVMHSAFYGTVVGAVFGFKKDSPETAVLAAIWFVVLLYISRLLRNHLEELEEKERSDFHRKTAGTTRSIVRSELEKAAQRRTEGWSDN